MAVELTLKRIEAAFHKRSQPVHVPPHILLGAAAAIVVVCLAGILAGMHNAERDRKAALTRYNDAQALLALPPLSTDGLKADLATAKFQVGVAQLQSAQSVDLASDDVIAQLVREAQTSGLAVSGVSRITPGTAKIADATYDVHGVRIVTDGSPAQLLAFLATVQEQLPSLFPTLTSMTVNDAGAARAEIAFNAYSKLATPTPPAPVATRSAPR